VLALLLGRLGEEADMLNAHADALIDLAEVPDHIAVRATVRWAGQGRQSVGQQMLIVQ
jgi:hypothetical protein